MPKIRTAADVKRVVLDKTRKGEEAEAVQLLQQLAQDRSLQLFGRALPKKEDPLCRTPLILAIDYRLPACVRLMLEALGRSDGDGSAAATVAAAGGRTLVPAIVTVALGSKGTSQFFERSPTGRVDVGQLSSLQLVRCSESANGADEAICRFVVP